jgi:hypothetical protein
MTKKNFKEKLSKLKNRLFSSYLVKNIFTKVNFNKFLIIFTVGVISRAFVNNICGINVYIDFLNYISILYYIAFSVFIVIVHDVASHTGFSLIPVFVLDILNFIISKIKLVLESFTKSIYTTIKNSMLMFSKLKYNDFKISSIRKVLKNSNFNFKDKMYLEDFSNDRNIRHNNKDTLLNTYVLNKNKDGSSNSHSSSRPPSNGRPHSNGRHHSSNNSISDSSSNRGIRNNDSRTMNNSVNTSNNVVRSNTNNIKDNRLLFVVGTMNDGRGSIPLVSPAPTVLPSLSYVPNNSPYPTMPAGPNPSRLTTPSLPSFPGSVNSVNSVNNTELIWSVNSANPDPVANNTNTRYSNSNYSNSIASTSSNPISGQSPYFNPTRSSNSTNQATLGLNGSNERLWLMDRDGPGPGNWLRNPVYLNNSRESIWHPFPSNNTTPIQSVDLMTSQNSSLALANRFDAAIAAYEQRVAQERAGMVRQNAPVANPAPAPVANYAVVHNYQQRVLEENAGLVSKFSAYSTGLPNQYSPVLPNEYVIEKKGILGRAKLGIKSVGKTLESIESVYLKYAEKGKQKFIWTLWESTSGNYESYEDFKNSWDPTTSVWSEIKYRTRKDLQGDIEQILGVTKNRKPLDLGISNRIEPIRVVNTGVTRQAENLVNNNQPFTNNQPNVASNDNTTNACEAEVVKTSHKHRHGHKHSHKHGLGNKNYKRK